MPEPHLQLGLKAHLSPRLAMRFSNVLEMSEDDASRLATLLEASPVFQKLFRPENPEWKVFSRQKFPASRLSTSFYEIPEQTRENPGTPDVEKLLEKHGDLVEKIRGMGVEKFERYFLHEELDWNVQTIAEELGVSEDLVKSIQQLTDQIMMNPDFFASRLAAPSPLMSQRYTRLAEYSRDSKDGWEIMFLSSSMARGTYKINYERLKKLKNENVLDEKELKTIRETIRMLEMINSRRTLIYRVLMLIPKWQPVFFGKGDWDDLLPYAQKKAAVELGVNPAAVCRAIQDRSVIAPGGQEVPLADFFPSQKNIRKRKISELVRKNEDKTDAEIQKIMQDEFGIVLSRRSVNVYRNEILKKT